MEKIRSLIGESIKLAGEQYQKSKKESNEDTKYHEKQRAQSKYFNLTKDQLSGLKIDKDIVKGVHFNNLSYCLRKFLQEEAEIIEETNFCRKLFLIVELGYFLNIVMSKGSFKMQKKIYEVFFSFLFPLTDI